MLDEPQNHHEAHECDETTALESTTEDEGHRTRAIGADG